MNDKMNGKKRLAATLIAALGLAVAIGSIAIAEPAKDAKDTKPAKELEFKLPPGWTQADMEACMLAGTPGKMQQQLVQEAGVWEGKTTMWMGPEGEALTSECTSTVTPIMEGRFTKVEMKAEMPGMGPYNGFGLYGFDNVSEKFVSTWIDNHSTGIMNGTGARSSDGKTLTWNYTVNCPLTKKPTALRQVEKITGKDTKTLEMFGSDPKSGKEYKMMSIEFTKNSK